MSETVREWLAARGAIATPSPSGSVMLMCPIESDLLDARIIPGANAVVTAEGLEAAALALSRWTDYSTEAARAALEAAGIEFVDDVVEVTLPMVWIGSDGKRTPLLVGDRVFFKLVDTTTTSSRRTVTANCRGKERED